MKKYVLLILVCLPTLFFCLWTFQLSGQVENARLVTVPLRGYDPRDLLAGHYIQYDIDRNQFNVRIAGCRIVGRNAAFTFPKRMPRFLIHFFVKIKVAFPSCLPVRKGEKQLPSNC